MVVVFHEDWIYYTKKFERKVGILVLKIPVFYRQRGETILNNTFLTVCISDVSGFPVYVSSL